MRREHRKKKREVEEGGGKKKHSEFVEERWEGDGLEAATNKKIDTLKRPEIRTCIHHNRDLNQKKVERNHIKHVRDLD
jgi:hypothetical protein